MLWTSDKGGIGTAAIACVIDSVEIGVKNGSMRVFLGDPSLKHHGKVKGFVVIDGIYVKRESCIVDDGPFTQKGGIKVKVASIAAVVVCTPKNGSKAKIGDLSHTATGCVELPVAHTIRGRGGHGGVDDDATPQAKASTKEKNEEET